MIFTSIDI